MDTDRTEQTARAAAPAEPSDDLVGLIGRDADLARVRDLIAGPAHLVTIVGGAGMGKTRLALEVARRDDAVVVRLSDARTIDAVLAAVGAALGASPAATGRDAIAARIARAIAARGPQLIVLDNFEQLTQLAPATVGRWLAEAPQARFLVTSREVLRIAGEWLHEVAPLSLDGDGDRDSDAVRLLRSRIAQARGGRPAADTTAELVAIARRVDGIPLALELAAQRIAVFGAVPVLARLGSFLDFLSDGRREADPARRTLRSTIAWSWSLLLPHERSALAQCAIFPGSFDAETAEHVISLDVTPDRPADPAADQVADRAAGLTSDVTSRSAAEPGVDMALARGSASELRPGDPTGAPCRDDVLTTLQALRDKSLIIGDAAATTRFRLLVPIREFALDQLAADDAERAHDRHAAYILDRAERRAAELPELSLLAALEQDRDDLSAILARAQRGGAAHRGVLRRAVRVIAPLILARGPVQPLLEALEAAAMQPSRTQPVPVAPTDTCSVEPQAAEPRTVEPRPVEPRTVEPRTVEPRTVEPRTVEPRTDEPRTVEPRTVEPRHVEPPAEPRTVEPQAAGPHGVELLLLRARLLRRVGRIAEAEALFQGALDRGLAPAPYLHGEIAYCRFTAGRISEALAGWAHARATRAVVNPTDHGGEGADLVHMAFALRELGRFDEAEARAAEARSIAGHRNDTGGETNALTILALIACDRGAAARGLRLGREAVERAHTTKSSFFEGLALSAVAMAHHILGELDDAEALVVPCQARLAAVGLCRLDAGALMTLGLIAWEQGDLYHARLRLDDAHELYRAIGDTRYAAHTIAALGAIDADEDHLAAASHRFAGLPPDDGTPLALAIATHRLHLPIAQARAAEAAGAPETAARLRAEVRRKLDEPGVGWDWQIARRLCLAVLDHGAATLIVQGDGTSCVIGETTVDLGKRAAARALLVTLAQRRLDHPGQPVSWSELVAAGWPAERMLPQSARNRVKVTIAWLRRVGLRDIIQSDDRGYWLRRGTRVVFPVSAGQPTTGA